MEGFVDWSTDLVLALQHDQKGAFQSTPHTHREQNHYYIEAALPHLPHHPTQTREQSLPQN